MSYESHMQTEVTIQKPTKTQTGLKSTTRTWADTTAYGNIEQLSGAQLVMMGRLGKKATHIIYLLEGDDIDTGYRVQAAGITYEVEGVQAAAGGTRSHHIEAFLVRRD